MDPTEFLGDIEEGYYKKQTDSLMGEALAEKLARPYLARLEAFWDWLSNDEFFSKNLNRGVRNEGAVVGELFQAFMNWLVETEGMDASGDVVLALLGKQDEVAKFFYGRLDAWDLEHRAMVDYDRRLMAKVIAALARRAGMEPLYHASPVKGLTWGEPRNARQRGLYATDLNSLIDTWAEYAAEKAEREGDRKMLYAPAGPVGGRVYVYEVLADPSAPVLAGGTAFDLRSEHPTTYGEVHKFLAEQRTQEMERARRSREFYKSLGGKENLSEEEMKRLHDFVADFDPADESGQYYFSQEVIFPEGAPLKEVGYIQQEAREVPGMDLADYAWYRMEKPDGEWVEVYVPGWDLEDRNLKDVEYYRSRGYGVADFRFLKREWELELY